LTTSSFVSRGQRGRRGTCRHPPSFRLACGTCGTGMGLVALGRRWSPVTPHHFAWQAWHLPTSSFVRRGRHGASGTGLGLVAPLVGMALGSHPPSFLRGSRGTWRHLPAFGEAGGALVALGWVWWRAWSPLVARDATALCVAGVVLGDIHDAAARYLAGVALGDIHLRFARHWRHPRSICVAGVALGDIHLHLRARRGTWGTGLALGWLWWRVWSLLVAKIRQT
jgi:hypothetical protein